MAGDMNGVIAKVQRGIIKSEADWLKMTYRIMEDGSVWLYDRRVAMPELRWILIHETTEGACEIIQHARMMRSRALKGVRPGR